MSSLYSFSNHVGDLSAHAIETRTHRFRSHAFGITGGNIAANPTKLFLGYPSLLTTSWSHPDSGCSTTMNDRKTPLSLQFQDIAIGNQFSSERVNNLNYIFSQDKFRSDPEKVSRCAQNNAHANFKGRLNKIGNHDNTVDAKEEDQDKGNTGPRKIASRSKSFIHISSIAGETR